MPTETAEVYTYCLNSDQAAQKSDELLQMGQQHQESLWKRLAQQSGTG